MSKQTKGYAAEDFTHVTPALLARISAVVADQAVRRYSSSAIYKAHNELFKLRETQQTCDTCLVIRATAIKKWKDWYDGITPVVTPAVQIPVVNVGPDGQGDPNLVPITGGAPDSMPATTAPVADPQTGEPTGQTQSTGEAAKDVAIVNPTEVLPTGTQVNSEAAPQIILQKINKDTYAPEGDPLYGTFTASADDANKGTVLNSETGKALAPGTYATENVTKVLAVSVGGHATYKDVPQA